MTPVHECKVKLTVLTVLSHYYADRQQHHQEKKTYYSTHFDKDDVSLKKLSFTTAYIISEDQFAQYLSAPPKSPRGISCAVFFFVSQCDWELSRHGVMIWGQGLPVMGHIHLWYLCPNTATNTHVI